jgi:Domain of unknown function (DUF4129)
MSSGVIRLDVARLALAMCLVLGFIARSGAAPSPPQSISLQEYIAELDRCSAALESSEKDPAALQKLERSLPTEWKVDTGNQQYTVSSEWLRANLARAGAGLHPDRSAIEQAQRELASYREAAQALAQSTSPSDLDKSRAQLNRILAGKEFEAIHGPTWFETLRARIYDWILRQIDKLVGKLGHGRAIGNAIAWTLIILSTLVLWFWVVRATTRVAAPPKIDLHGANTAGQDSHYWLRQARTAAAGGDYRSAIHAAYWAAIARLEEARLLTENRSRTPRETLRLIRPERAEYAPLSNLTRRFELVWYGYRSADPADWSDAVEQLEKLGCPRSSTPAISVS